MRADVRVTFGLSIKSEKQKVLVKQHIDVKRRKLNQVSNYKFVRYN